jgi:hypothetical protein
MWLLELGPTRYDSIAAWPVKLRYVTGGFPGGGYGKRHMRKKSLAVYQLAVRMAGSGKFKNWKGIRDGLVEKGYKRAPDLLDDDRIRAILDIHCEESQKAERNSKRP